MESRLPIIIIFCFLLGVYQVDFFYAVQQLICEWVFLTLAYHSSNVDESLIDSECILWNTVCGRKGACLLYVADSLLKGTAILYSNGELVFWYRKSVKYIKRYKIFF